MCELGGIVTNVTSVLPLGGFFEGGGGFGFFVCFAFVFVFCFLN